MPEVLEDLYIAWETLADEFESGFYFARTVRGQNWPDHFCSGVWRRRGQADKAKKLEKRLPNFRIFPNQTEVCENWIRNASRLISQAYGSGRLLLMWILAAKEWIGKGI